MSTSIANLNDEVKQTAEEHGFDTTDVVVEQIEMTELPVYSTYGLPLPDVTEE